MNAKEILAKVRALFDAPIVAPPIVPAAAAVPPPAAPTGVATPFKLADGTDITITIDDPSVSTAPDAGDIVMIAGVPAPAGDYTLQDGTTFTTDATGAITVITMPTPATQPAFVAPPALTLEDRIKAIEVRINAPGVMAAVDGVGGLTTDQLQAMYAKFATGSTEERVSNLEIMMKALMDNSFGYQIRQGQENAAIQAYKDTLAPMITTMSEYKAKLETAEAKVGKQDGIISGLFELVEKLVDEPSAEPVTLTGNQKIKFDRMSAKEERMKGYAKAIQERKVLN